MRSLIFRLSLLFIIVLVGSCSNRLINNVYRARTSTDSMLRSGPGPEYALTGQIASGTEVTLLESRNDWNKIRLPNGDTGWIFKGLVQSVGPSRIVVRNDASIRTGPGVEYKIFAIAKKGKALDLLDEKNDWYQVDLTDGKSGWISKNDADKLVSSTPTGTTNQIAAGAQTVTIRDRAFLRRGPSIQYETFGIVEKGERLTLLNERNGWFEVRDSSGKRGWIFKDFIMTSGAGASSSDSGAETIINYDRPEYVITNQESNIRQGYGTNWDRIARVKQGTLLLVIGQKDVWLRVRMPDQRIGWIRNDLIERNPTILIALQQSNVRQGPGTNFGIKTRIESGSPLVKISEQEGWSRVYLPDGEIAWIRNDLVSDLNLTLYAKEDSNVRQGAGISTQQIDRIPQGTPVVQLDKQGEWFRVRLPSGKEGWIREDLLTSSSSQLITNDRVAVRKGPGEVYDVLTELEKNTPLTKVDQKDGWFQVKLSDGRLGWIRSDMVSFSYFTYPSGNQLFNEGFSTQSSSLASNPTTTKLKTNATIHLRTGPDTNETIIRTLAPGESLSRVNQAGEWFEVLTVDGVRGFVHQSGFGTTSKQIVTNTKSNIRYGPNTSYEIIATVPEKTALTIIEQRDNWANVRLPDGRKGWIQTDLLNLSAVTVSPHAPTAEPASGTIISIKDSKIYEGPATTFPIIKSVSINTEARKIGKSKGWSQVELYTGEKGWINNDDIEEKINKKIIAIRRADVREQPNAQANIIGMLDLAEFRAPLNQESGWYRITYKPGSTGWVSKQDVYDLKYPPVYVNIASVDVLRYPEKKANRLAIVNEGVELNPIDENDEWLFIELPRGDKGWIPKKNVDRQKHPRILITKDTEAYEQPSAGSFLRATLAKDDQFLALDKKGNWYKILLRGSTVGWVYGVYCQEITKGMLMIKDDSLLRMGPGLEYRKIVEIRRGEQVKWLTEKNGWSQVQLSSGEVGWVKLDQARDVTMPAMVANEEAIVRAGPGNSYAKVGIVQKGKKYTPLKKESGWYQLRLPSGTEGWVAMDIFSTKKSRLVFTLDSATIHQGPGSHYAIVARLEPAIDLNILGTEGNWYYVQLQDGKKGYIRRELVFEE